MASEPFDLRNVIGGKPETPVTVCGNSMIYAGAPCPDGCGGTLAASADSEQHEIFLIEKFTCTVCGRVWIYSH